MIPPKVIGIIGHLGKMATEIVWPLFEEAGYEMIGSDIKDPEGLTNEEVAERSDVVYFSILPIEDTAEVMQGLIPHAKEESLWLNGASVQHSYIQSPITVMHDHRLIEKRIDVGFLHFMVAPSVKSLRGQSVIYGFLRDLILMGWEDWLIGLLLPKRPVLLKYPYGYHDQIIFHSTVVPQLMALMNSQLWKESDIPLADVLRIAGPPCWLQNYGMIRNLGQPAIISEILMNHPQSTRAIDQMVSTLRAIQRAIGSGKKSEILELAEEGLQTVPPEELENVRENTNWHIRLEGDMRGNAVCFEFTPEQNQIGLLVKVLTIFDDQNLDKTSCMCQELPDRTCRFHIGVTVERNDPRLDAACRQVVTQLGAKMVAI